MPSRLIKKTVVLAKVETTQGVDAAPTGAANAIQVSNLSISPVEAKTANINMVAAWFGASVDMVTTSFVKCSFEVLMGGSGTAATAPAWGQLLLGCGMSETTGLLTPNRVEYDVLTGGMKYLTIYWYDDGVLHKMLGAMGNVKPSFKAGDVPKLAFEFFGIDGIPTATANAAAVLTAWKIPPAVTKANVVDVTLGCTYAAGALSGGTVYNSTGLTLDFGNKVEFAPMLSNEEIVFSDRDIKGSVELELTAAQEVAQIANVKANFSQSMGFTLGTVSGNKIMLYAPAVQLMGYKKAEVAGKRLIGFDMHLNPLNGNDELKIILL